MLSSHILSFFSHLATTYPPSKRLNVHRTRHLQNFALGMGIIAVRLVRSTEANAEPNRRTACTARPEGERPNNHPCLVVC